MLIRFSPNVREGNEKSSHSYDPYIEKAWKYTEMEEIENLAAERLGKAQEGQSIEDDLLWILYLAFRCGFKKGHRVATG